MSGQRALNEGLIGENETAREQWTKWTVTTGLFAKGQSAPGWARRSASVFKNSGTHEHLETGSSSRTTGQLLLPSCFSAPSFSCLSRDSFLFFPVQGPGLPLWVMQNSQVAISQRNEWGQNPDPVSLSSPALEKCLVFTQWDSQWYEIAVIPSQALLPFGGSLKSPSSSL